MKEWIAVGMFDRLCRSSKKLTSNKYLLTVSVLLVHLLTTLIHAPSVSATPTFDSFSISSAYTNAAQTVTAGGDLWYFQKSSSAIVSDSIGRMTTSGVTTDYSIGSRPGQTNPSTIQKLIIGPDGNVWFTGSDSGGGFLGKLDISTGVVTFYTAGGYSAGNIAASSDGKIYYTYKSSGSPAQSYLRSLDPSTGVTAAVETFDTYANIKGSMTSGPDGRLYIADAYYNRIYARSLSGGTNDTFVFSSPVSNLASGSDGNIWLSSSGKVIKMTPAGSTTEYTLPAGVSADRLVAGPDGAMWFVSNTTNAAKIGRITTLGVITVYPIPGTNVNSGGGGITLGPDGAIWFSYRTSTGHYLGRLPAAPTFTNFSITSAYTNASQTVVAGGDLWYFQKSSGASVSDSIGRMTTSGVTTDYSIGSRPGQTNPSTIQKLIIGPDGNVWFTGSDSGGGFLGKLDISTGTITFYTAGGYSAGAIAAGSDGKIYYTYKSSGSPAKSYLRSLDPSTGVTAAVETFDTYANIKNSMISGSDGRLYITDAYYKRIYARSLSGGANDTFFFSAPVGNLTSGPDGNVWFGLSGNIAKMTPTGSTTEYSLPTGVSLAALTAGSDGAMWFVDGTNNAAKIGRITTTGSTTIYPMPGTNANSGGGITLGPDGAIWFSYRTSSPLAHSIGRLGY